MDFTCLSKRFWRVWLSSDHQMFFKFNKKSESDNREMTGCKTRPERAGKTIWGVWDGSLDGYRRSSSPPKTFRLLGSEAFESCFKSFLYTSRPFLNLKVPPKLSNFKKNKSPSQKGRRCYGTEGLHGEMCSMLMSRHNRSSIRTGRRW